MRVKGRKILQPSQPFFPDARHGWSNRLSNHRKNIRELRLSGGKFRQAFRRPQHLIGVPADSGPPERANLIDDLRRMRSAGRQIAAVNHEIRRDLSQIGEHRLERAAIAVNIRYDGDPQFCLPLGSR